jgi:hypothetical protein
VGSSIALYLVGHETLGRWDGADWTYCLPDALGSIRQATDGTGAVTDSPGVDAVRGGGGDGAGGFGVYGGVADWLY